MKFSIFPDISKKDLARYVEDSYAEMILKFAIAAEYKDDDTGKHIVRVSDYSTAIARALRMSSHNINILRFASIMHDIGKVGVPDRILRKKKFNSNDYRVMKKHTLAGAKIFGGSNSPLLKAAGEIAQSHHEKYNGRGYPLGLKGEEIPIFGRIVALADSFDAIVSKRVYKKSESFSKAIAKIKRQKGKQFDPKVVDAFLKALPRIMEIFVANKAIDDYVRENKKMLKKR
ncbi:HD-GYP domain-containing protein [Candidatus Omnitrophota bacterium]